MERGLKQTSSKAEVNLTKDPIALLVKSPEETSNLTFKHCSLQGSATIVPGKGPVIAYTGHSNASQQVRNGFSFASAQFRGVNYNFKT